MLTAAIYKKGRKYVCLNLMPKLNYKIIFYLMGLLLIVNSGFMLIAAIISFAIQDGVAVSVSAAGLITLFTGMLLMFVTRDHKRDIKKREGYLVVTLGWLIMTCLLYTSPSPRDRG